MIQDIDRPDKNGVPAKMQEIALQAKTVLTEHVLSVQTDDNLMSSIQIRGSFDPRETWANGIWENSRYFRFAIIPEKGKRYYSPGEKVTVELRGSWKLPKFRKSTTTPEKALQRIQKWIAQVS